MDYKNIGKKIIELQNADLELRDKLIEKGELSKAYNEEMEALHKANTKTLDEILDLIGYPTIDKVGKEASEAAWLVIQHSISNPNFMKKGLRLLTAAVEDNNADPKGLAYLQDRIAVFEGIPQEYGTQFDWDENGELSPQLYDDLAKVNQRRSSIGLNSLEEQTLIMRKRAENEKEYSPIDFEKRMQEMNKWKRKVGWIK